MKRKEAVINAFCHKANGPVPYHIDLTSEMVDIMQKHTGNPKFPDNEGTYLNYGQYWGWPTELENKPGYFLDEYGVTWNRSGKDKDIGVIDSPVISEPDISLWKEPCLDETRLRKEWDELIASKDDRFTFPGIGFSMFERAWSLCGMENVLIYMSLEPEFLHDLLDRICEYNIKIIDMSLEYPFDGFYFGDDWGQQKGLIMGPEMWKKFFKPRMERMYSRVKEAGRFVIQHSCGDVSEIFSDLIEIGLDCYQTFQPEIYDIKKIKEEYGTKLSFWGGISTQRLLPFACPEEVYEETKRITGIMAKSGGYIAAPTHAIPGDVPPENIIAMLRAFKERG